MLTRLLLMKEEVMKITIDLYEDGFLRAQNLKMYSINEFLNYNNG